MDEELLCGELGGDTEKSLTCVLAFRVPLCMLCNDFLDFTSGSTPCCLFPIKIFSCGVSPTSTSVGVFLW